MHTTHKPLLLALLCAIAFSVTALAQTQPVAPAAPPSGMTTDAATAEPAAPKIAPEQVDSLVAPIALYPDPLLAQTLAASTYPLEVIQLQQWMANNKTLKDKALADAV